MSRLSMEIKHNKGGYYTLMIDGKFAGNYDSVSEAVHEYENMVEELSSKSARLICKEKGQSNA